MQHAVCSSFLKHRILFSQEEISLLSKMLVYFIAFCPEVPLSVSAMALELSDSLLFLFERNPTHSEHCCHLAPYSVF